MNTTERIKYFFKNQGVTIKSVEEKINKANGYFNSTVNYSLDAIIEISKLFPNLNLNWLITGKGEMMQKELSNKLENNKDKNITGESIDVRLDRMESNQKKSDQLLLLEAARVGQEMMQIHQRLYKIEEAQNSFYHLLEKYSNEKSEGKKGKQKGAVPKEQGMNSKN